MGVSGKRADPRPQTLAQRAGVPGSGARIARPALGSPPPWRKTPGPPRPQRCGLGPAARPPALPAGHGRGPHSSRGSELTVSPGTAPHSSRVNPKPVLQSIHLSPDLWPPVPLPVPIPRSVALHPVETIKDPAPRMRTGRHVSPELAVARVPAAGGRDGFVLGGGDGSVGGGGCGLRTAELALGAGSRRGRRGTCLDPLAGRGSGAPRSLSRLACATRALGIGGPRGPRLWVREPGLPPPRQMRFSCCAPWPFLKSPQSRCPQGGGPAAPCCWR